MKNVLIPVLLMALAGCADDPGSYQRRAALGEMSQRLMFPNRPAAPTTTSIHCYPTGYWTTCQTF
jgi:LPS sulfotransferase NodH